MQCMGIGPHLSASGKSHGFSRVAAGNWGMFWSYGGGSHEKLLFVHRRQDSCLVTMYTSGNYTTLSRTIQTHLEVKQETEFHFLVGTVILGFLSIFKKSKASSPFESLDYVRLSRCQSDMIPPVQMRRRTTAFSRVSTGDSDIPSSCDMKHEPKFKPL